MGSQREVGCRVLVEYLWRVHLPIQPGNGLFCSLSVTLCLEFHLRYRENLILYSHLEDMEPKPAPENLYGSFGVLHYVYLFNLK